MISEQTHFTWEHLLPPHSAETWLTWESWWIDFHWCHSVHSSPLWPLHYHHHHHFNAPWNEGSCLAGDVSFISEMNILLRVYWNTISIECRVIANIQMLKTTCFGLHCLLGAQLKIKRTLRRNLIMEAWENPDRIIIGDRLMWTCSGIFFLELTLTIKKRN